jgi:hypothetical protein
MPESIEHDGERLQRVHQYPFANVLRPRGGECKKESVSAYLADRLWAAFWEWTDADYADSRSPDQVVARIESNLADEVQAALESFRRRVAANR